MSMNRRKAIISMIFIMCIISITAFAWYDTVNYTYRYPIYHNSSSIIGVYSVNDTNGVGLNHNTIWARIFNESYVYSSGIGTTGNIVIANDTTLKYYENETSGQGNLPQDMWNANGVVAGWHMNSTTGTIEYDFTGRAECPLTEQTGGINITKGLFGYGYSGNDTASSYARTSTSSCVNGANLGNNSSAVNYSISAWFKLNQKWAGGTGQCIMSKVAPSLGNYGFMICLYDITGKLTFYKYGGTSINSVTAVFQKDIWYNVIVVDDGFGLSLYINGTNETGADNKADGTDTWAENSVLKTAIGSRYDSNSDTPDRFFNGTIDEVRVYNRSLTQTEITNMYYNGRNILTSTGTEEHYTILEIYNNKTNNNSLSFKYGDTFSTNITTTNTSSTQNINRVFFELNGDNYTGTKITSLGTDGGGEFNWNTTLTTLTPATTYTIKQFIEDTGTANTNVTNSSTYFDIYFDYWNNNTATMSVTPSTSVNYGTSTTATCSVGGGTAVLLRDGAVVANPNIETLNAGTYNYTCIATETGHYNATDTEFLRVRSGLNVTNYSICGSSLSAYGIWAINSTGSTYQNTSVQVNDIVNLGLLGNTYIIISNDTDLYQNSTFNHTFTANTYYEKNVTAYRNRLINFNVLDETDLSDIYFDVNIYNTTTNLTYSDVTNITANYNVLPYGESTIALSNSTGEYVLRNYVEDIDYCTYLTDDLFMLKTDEGHYVMWHVYNSLGSAIENANVTITKSTGEVVEAEYTDASGTATTWLNPDYTYTIYVSATGYESYSANIRPSNSDYSIYLGGSISPTSEFMYKNMYFKWVPSTYIVQFSNSTTYQISINYTITSYDNMLNNSDINCYYNSSVVYYNYSNSTSGTTYYALFNVTVNSTGHTVGNISVDDSLYCLSSFNKTGFNELGVNNKAYTITDIETGNYTLGTTIAFAGQSLTHQQWGFIAIMISILAGIMIGGIFGNVIGGGATTAGVMSIFVYLGVLNIMVPVFAIIALISYTWIKKGGS